MDVNVEYHMDRANELYGSLPSRPVLNQDSPAANQQLPPPVANEKEKSEEIKTNIEVDNIPVDYVTAQEPSENPVDQDLGVEKQKTGMARKYFLAIRV